MYSSTKPSAEQEISQRLGSLRNQGGRDRERA